MADRFGSCSDSRHAFLLPAGSLISREPQSGGHIRVQTEPGVWTTFRVALSAGAKRAWVERMRPGIRGVVMSGPTDDDVLRRGVLTSDVAFIQKPFTPQALARRVRQELDRPAT